MTLTRKTPLSRSPIKRKTTRKCKVCRQEFAPWRPGVKVCGEESCMHAYALSVAEKSAAKREKEAAKAERESVKARKEKAKRPKTLKSEAQQAFNAFIRYRDLTAGHNCICCGKPFEPQKPGGSIDAGHYLSRGSAPHLKFDERNCFAQRKNCNRPGGTTAAAFRLGVEARIGREALEALEADQEQKQYRDDDYRRIRDTYRQKLKELKGRNE